MNIDLTLADEESARELSSWINTGKLYNNVPDFVSNGLLQKLSLSDTSQALLPSPKLTILELLDVDLPNQLDAAILTAPISCFSDANPNTSTACLLKHSMPSRGFLTRLRAVAGQAMLDGKLSIVDWTNKDIFLPFEALSFWEFLLEAASSKKAWTRARKWIAQHRSLSMDPKIVARIEHVFNTVTWRSRALALGGHVTVTEMADFFSCLDLSGSHVDTLLELIRMRLDNGDASNQMIIGSTTFFDYLSGTQHYDAGSATTEAQKIGEHLQSHPTTTTILGVAYSPPRHWAAILIESSLSGVQVHWGDSIQRKRPKSLTTGLRTFLESHIKSGVSIEFHDDLKCASQPDGYSCPIISINTIKHFVFGETLWTQKSREIIRVQEFLDAMEFCFPLNLATQPIAPLLLASTATSAPPQAELNITMDVDLPRSSSHADFGTETKPPSSTNSFFLPRKRSHSAKHEPSTTLAVPELRPQKRQRQLINSDTENVNEKSDNLSKSAIRKRMLNEAVRSGTLVIDALRWKRYVNKLKELDPHVEVDESDPQKACHVRHSRCSQWLIMATVYDLSYFKNHVKRCNVKTPLNPAANTHTLKAMGVLQINSASNIRRKKNLPLKMWPCPGLTEHNDVRISQYLARTSVLSAGGISKKTIAHQLFDTQDLSSLSKKQRKDLRIESSNTHTWRIDHELQCIFAIGESPCLQHISLPSDHKDGDEIPPCTSCSALLSSRAFLTAINRPVPKSENLIYTPHEYLSAVLGRKLAENQGLRMLYGNPVEVSGLKKDIFLRFARHLSAGNFDKQPVFLDLIEVMTDTAEREAHSRGMQNKRYPPALDDWLHELQCIRPEAYRSFRSTFVGRTERSFAQIRSQNPSFTQGITPQILERVKKYLNDYNYPEGAPIAIGVDDTKLFPALRPYFDAKKDKWFLIGSAGEPMEIADIDSLQKQIAEAADLMAEKLRLWTFSILLPHVPPLILAVEPILSKIKASEVANMEIALLELLLRPSSKLTIISLGSDGSTVEREARRELIRKKFASYVYHRIPHPEPSQPPIQIEILRKDTHYMACIQDPKHALKTARNNMFSGAKCLTLGRYVVNYEQVRHLAFKDDSPLYSRDVDKLDRQDDRAAARLFSAHTLQFAIDNLADELGLIIYLFVFGEMIDAYQNRQIAHIDRVKMVLRAQFFKDIWKRFLKESGYSEAQHFMSKEADDITNIIVNGYLGLVIIHRDHLDKPFPLLPWAHGSQPGEHIFGFLRFYFPDFTMLDVLRLVPKIGVRLMAACKRKNLKADFKKTASGYSHTYFDGTDINLQNLAVFPTDDEMQSATSAAYEEALSLWILLGYSPEEGTSESVYMASDNIEGVEIDGGDEICCNTTEYINAQSEHDELEGAFMEATELYGRGLPSDKTDKALDECGYAAAALNINDIDRIESLPDSDPAALDEIRSALAVILSTIAASNQSGQETVMELIQWAKEQGTGRDVPSMIESSPAAKEPLPIQIINVSDMTQLKELVKIRLQNQCRESAEGVRTKKNMLDTDPPADSKSKPLSDRQKLAKKIHEVLRLETEKGSSSGLNRRVRWEKTAAGSVATSGDNVVTGNSANARVAARTVSNEMIKRRRQEFHVIPGICSDDLATAKVDLISRLKRGSFGVVIYEGELMIGKIVTMYEKGGGKAAKHAWVSEATSMGSVSYLSVQIWKQTSRYQRYFRAVWHPKLKQHGLPHFAHLPGAAFLHYIPPGLIQFINDGTVELLPSFFNGVFSGLLMQDKPIIEAVKNLLKRPSKKDV